MLIEIQALVCPQVSGCQENGNRTGLQQDYFAYGGFGKESGMQLHNYDAYVNVVGGLKIDEPACDLGVVTAIASSFRNIPVDMDTVLIGEVGLTGEVRAVSQIDKRIREAVRIGFKNCVVPAGNMKVIKQMKDINNINVKFVENVQEALNIIL